ncbi:TetR/AcrR family transcriptional regulator [uncultured Rikenella sp.]|uniref:TetR/AcrR family transcriptional regulator n=1 Tax=uncultured Rikenella sp. TaxID=368003 RepID=UPI0026250F01|nr:TetR/AcrR family transcriptional regulator [uncultured Rikenella sp.]
MPAKTKTNTKKTPAAQIMPQEEISTREMILRRSLELINAKGMVDFRIDTLATSLGLSPGNITYHFSRKEDICAALWEQYLEEYGQVVRSLTTLLDIKQLYLLNRINIHLNYKYRGVVVFRSADLGAIKRDQQAGRVNEDEHFAMARRAMQLLKQNGYIDKNATEEIIEGTHIYHYIMTRWSINFAYQAYTPEEVEAKLDYLALMSLHALYPTLSQKGRDEFAEVLAKVSAGNLLGEKR